MAVEVGRPSSAAAAAVPEVAVAWLSVRFTSDKLSDVRGVDADSARKQDGGTALATSTTRADVWSCGVPHVTACGRYERAECGGEQYKA